MCKENTCYKFLGAAYSLDPGISAVDFSNLKRSEGWQNAGRLLGVGKKQAFDFPLEWKMTTKGYLRSTAKKENKRYGK